LVAGAASELERIWRAACRHEVLPGHGGKLPRDPRREQPPGKGGPRVPGGAGGVANPVLPQNNFGDTVRGDLVPKCKTEKTKGGGFKSLCVKASLAADRKCPMKNCRYSHSRLLTDDELRLCLFFASTALPAGAAELRD
jgi:hypothetical protein